MKFYKKKANVGLGKIIKFVYYSDLMRYDSVWLQNISFTTLPALE